MRKEIKLIQQVHGFTLAKNHYENFPVVSFLLPRKFRKDVAAIYWFARTADDIADELKADENTKLELLQKFEDDFLFALNGNKENRLHKILADTIHKREISVSYFLDLLSAFKQDVVKNRYKTFDDVTNYCARSANPVGRIMLELLNIRNEEVFIYSDKICTALQLTNFYQDFSRDLAINRIYIPQDELEKFGVSEENLLQKKFDRKIQSLIKFQVERTQNLFDEGKNLYKYLSGRFKYEIKWTVLGGEKILEMIRKLDYNSIENRPHLNKIDFLLLLFKSFSNG